MVTHVIQEHVFELAILVKHPWFQWNDKQPSNYVYCKQWQLFGRSQAPDRLFPHEPTSSLRSLERGRVHFIGTINVKCSKREKDTKV